MKNLLLTLTAVFAFSATAHAQTGACPTANTVVANPSWICLDPAADHSATNPVTGAPVVTRYDVLFFAPGVDTATGAPVQTINIGKPTLNLQNVAWLQRAELGAIPVGQQYRARVVAVGPDGVSGRSPESNPFGRTAPVLPTAPERLSISAEQ
jgi:hypothetical protein